jgi:hypothetical protein
VTEDDVQRIAKAVWAEHARQANQGLAFVFWVIGVLVALIAMGFIAQAMGWIF